ncbi:DUF222 domain-containing protein [Rathayibacter sp. KR2-224]|uniref:HNH endonuclease signature motif containing protein n=1 Tax=Rathayibacter sp. KR2-224 TaxID=3400913 RepID=UPI003BFD1F3C
MLSNVERLRDTTSRVCDSLTPPNASEPVSLIESIDALDDDALAELIADSSRGRTEFDTVLTAAAGVAAKRSERALGHSGLAQRNGHQNVVRFVQHLTGSSRGEASRQVRLGEVMGEADAAERLLRTIGVSEAGTAGVDETGSVEGEEGGPTGNEDGGNAKITSGSGAALLPWTHSVTTAVSAGLLSPAAGDAIVRGLGEPSETCGSEELREAAGSLAEEARSVHVDELFGMARRARDLIDPAGVQARWQRRYDNRSLTTRRNQDGQLTANVVFDDESGTFVNELLELALSPRRGGPRFVADADREWAKQLLDDPRSNEQLAFDTVMDVLRCGAAADDSTTFRANRPAVRVMIVEDHAAPNGIADGIGHIEGSVDAVPSAVVETRLCDCGTLSMHTDRDGNVLDLGRAQRLFSSRQRLVLRTRDGGCVWPGCDRAPWTTEAHHINAWYGDNGRTDVADGVLLCRFHHLLLHNNGWKISREGTRYLLTPPASVDPDRGPIELHSKSAGWEHRRRTAARPPGRPAAQYASG